MRYDPTETLEHLRVPVLLQFGELDALVPPVRNVARWRELLARAGNRDVTVKVDPRSDHALFQMTRRGLERGLSPDGACLAIGSVTDLVDWIRARAGLSARGRVKTEACAV